MPSNATLSLATPAARALSHSPVDTTLAAQPRPDSSAVIAGRSLAFSEYSRSQGGPNAASSRFAAWPTAAASAT